MNDDGLRSTQPLIALLLVDLQRGMQRSDLPPRNNPGAEACIAELLAAWRAAGWPVVHIRHISRQPGSPFAPAQPGVEFQPALAPRDDEVVFEKNVPDAFINSGLQRWLHARDIRHLALAGVATENSVEASARSAGNLGFQTWVVADACFTFAKADFHGTPRSADEVHAMALANLHGEYAVALNAAELLQRLPSRLLPGQQPDNRSVRPTTGDGLATAHKQLIQKQ